MATWLIRRPVRMLPRPRNRLLLAAVRCFLWSGGGFSDLTIALLCDSTAIALLGELQLAGS